ncbi:MAC/Perforin domain-containing protein [Babesia caballi]|uniref:MAC/Perforin domain-containing protein n=1 Tax=Babesia caballi TaxID=5871 RepID=A0AAV4LXV4_BABCB|nr:MAC/Perforin domain-containing protein [Babesia caballi]
MHPTVGFWVAVAALIATNEARCEYNVALVEEKSGKGASDDLPPFTDDLDDAFGDDMEEEEDGEGDQDEFDQGVPGIDYLGIGYDSIFGNTLGSEDSLLDPGYRAPIISFRWRRNSEGYSPSLNAVYPLHGWVRPMYSCSRSSKVGGGDKGNTAVQVQEIQNLDELRKAFSASAELKGDVPSVSFSASAKYKKEAANISHKRERVYLHSDTCIRYQAGMPLNIPWKTTEEFKEAVSLLRPLADGVKMECSAHDIQGDVIKESCVALKNWISFFQMFGTHYVHRLLLGGKLLQTLKFSDSDVEDFKKMGVDLEAAVATSLGSASAAVRGKTADEASKIDNKGDKTITVIGGDMPNLPITDEEYAAWGNSVAKNPMPIGISAESLKGLLKKELHDSFSLALTKYAELNGITYEMLLKIGGSLGGLMMEIKHGNGVATVNWDVNGAQCPKGQKILLGLSLLFNARGTLLGIIPCNTGAYKCNVPLNNDEIRSVSWVTCTVGLQPDITQVADVTKDSAKSLTVACPHGSVIQFGMKLYGKEDRLIRVQSCEKGRKECTMKDQNDAVGGIWVVCSPENKHTNEVNLVADVGEGKGKVECGKDEIVIAGTRVIFKENKEAAEGKSRSMAIELCDPYLRECKYKCEKECIAALVVVVCGNTNTLPV